MKIHEYQAKELLKACGVPVLAGRIAYTPEEAKEAATALGGNVWVVKAQIHAGGRGKGGGIKLAKSVDEVASYAKDMLGMHLVTPQTGPQGQEVRRLYIEQGCALEKELYFSLLVDRATSRVSAIASSCGGMDIEEVAATMPDKIMTIEIDPALGLMPYQARNIAFGLGLAGKAALRAATLFEGCYRTFMAHDASLVEINPVAVTSNGDVYALDAKVTFEENALFRHEYLEELRDITEEDPTEREASKHSLSYIKLDGNIGCLVNGAGLAMATMDVIKLYGGEPANFLDVGGGAPRERVTTAFKLILADKNVEGILVNIFGGIMRCDIIAEGIVAAARDVGMTVPLVVRLEGTNVDLGKKILAESGLAIIPANDLGDAAARIVKAVKEAA
ncbi:MAG: ADP-forming succinate--CoA ligase subunit beta [Candidatus Puniceispirillum sp.]|nr:ADP-forming succinate--CoA ligase subunit beta [Candidatus Puniceispirillum sp.]